MTSPANQYAAGSSLLEVMARRVRDYRVAERIPCPSGHAPAGQPCYVIPTAELGAGQGIGWQAGQDRPTCCPHRIHEAAER